MAQNTSPLTPTPSGVNLKTLTPKELKIYLQVLGDKETWTPALKKAVKGGMDVEAEKRAVVEELASR